MISVIIPVFNRKELLKKCLMSLWRQDGDLEYEVIVADDGSSENISIVVKQFKTEGFNNLIYVRNAVNKGPAGARNLGLRSARGDIIAFVDSDVTVAPDWLRQGSISFTHDQIGGIEGKTIVTNKEKITPFTHQTENLFGKEYLTANIFYRHSVIKEVGGFDEQFTKPFREDSDIAFNVLDAGYQIIFNPLLLAYHPPLPGKLMKPLRQASFYYFDPLLFRKHPDRYKKELSVNQIGPFTTKRIFQKLSFFYTLFLLLTIAAWLLKSSVFFIFLICYSLSLLLAWFYTLRERISWLNAIKAIPLAVVVPLVAYFEMIKGCFRYRSFSPF